MAVISYPTKKYVEQFLNIQYPSNAPFNLNNSISVLGNSVGAHTTSGQFGILSGAVISSAQITGLDIPVMISDNFKEKGTVMIIEQDPLRNPNNTMLAPLRPYFLTHGIIGTPNALHYNVCCYPQTQIYRCIIDYIMRKKYNVYLTDANKLYWPYIAGSNPMSRWKNITTQQTLLNQEIQVITPYAILLVGSVAGASHKLLYPNRSRVIQIPHITARSSAWKKINVAPATNNNKLNYIISELQKVGV